MSLVAAPPAAEALDLLDRRRRGRRDLADDGRHWAPQWRRLLSASPQGGRGPPGSYDEFDRTVRRMLNRISPENAGRLLPLDVSLRSAGECEQGPDDSPPWWAARFAALMLTSYLQVIHTNRCARGLAMRSEDNVLPAYLDAVSPLLARSPRLVYALSAWLARLLRLHDLCWPTVRLLLLAAAERRDRAALAPGSLGRLPPEIIRSRLVPFLVPPVLPGALAEVSLPGAPARLCSCWNSEDGRRDVAAVLAHILLFAPPPAWPHLSAFAFGVVDMALAGPRGQEEGSIYLAASVLVAVAQRCEAAIAEAAAALALRREAPAAARSTPRQPPCGLRQLLADLGSVGRAAALLEERLRASEQDTAGAAGCRLDPFVRSRAQAAMELALAIAGERSAAERLLGSGAGGLPGDTPR